MTARPGVAGRNRLSFNPTANPQRQTPPALFPNASLAHGDEPLSTVLERITDIVVDKLGVDAADVNESSSFQDDLGADSLDLVELIMAFEEEFTSDDNTIEIPDEDAGEIHTIADAVAYLKDKGVTDD